MRLADLRNALAVKLTALAQWITTPIHAASRPSGRTVLVTGATGFIGGRLVHRLIQRGDAVLVLTRDADKALRRFGPHVRILTDLDQLCAEESVDAIVNLAGEPILGFPWTRRRRAALLDSRVRSTRGVVALMARLTKSVGVLVSASAIGYYGIHASDDVDEHCEPGTGFQSQLCREWEAAALSGQAFAARIVRIRIGLVLGIEGGALPKLAAPHRIGCGALIGSGRQWVSWIHVDDLIRLFEFALDKPAVRGVLNGVAPGPITHDALQRGIARSLRRPLWLRIPAWLIRLALGEMSQLLAAGQRVFPNRPVALGFHYRYPSIDAALSDLLAGSARTTAPRRRQCSLFQAFMRSRC